MRTANTFLAAAAIAAALSYSNHCLTAGAEKSVAEVPVATSQGTAVVNGCEITGKLVEESDGKVYAVLKAVNPTAEPVNADIHYAVSSMPETARYSRMVMMPNEVKRDCWVIALDGNSTKEDKLLVYSPPEITILPGTVETLAAVKELQVTQQEPVVLKLQTEWTLTISPAELPAGLGFGGATVAAPADGKVLLEKGQFVLARTELTAQHPLFSPATETTGAVVEQKS